MIAGLCTLLMSPARVLRSAIVLRPSTLLHFHHLLIKRKYRQLFSPHAGRRPGPKGPEKELIDAVVEMKRRNPTWGCPRIAEQITLAFGVDIDKDVVRRILGMHNRPESGSGGPSWLTFLGHAKDSLWSADLFCCESLTLRTHWVLIVMDQFTRRIVGFGIHRGIVDGSALCRMFQHAIQRQSLPRYLSTDNDPLYRFHQWQANLRVLEVTEIKTVPYVPISHPFVERLVGTLRRECLDRTLFWTHGRPGGEASRVLRLFQWLSLSCRIARTAARTSCRRTRKAGEPYLVSVAEALSRPLPHADRGVIL
jgi:transposase InsO family protein